MFFTSTVTATLFLEDIADFAILRLISVSDVETCHISRACIAKCRPGFDVLKSNPSLISKHLSPIILMIADKPLPILFSQRA
jgi:hypothetical protein